MKKDALRDAKATIRRTQDVLRVRDLRHIIEPIVNASDRLAQHGEGEPADKLLKASKMLWEVCRMLADEIEPQYQPR